MLLRSLLFVPGDSERKFEKARTIGADALILDLEDAVAPDQKDEARKLVCRFIDENRDISKRLGDWRFFVRVNDLESGLTVKDLSAVIRPGLDAILVPKSNGFKDIERISYYIDALEENEGMKVGTVKIAVVATETPTAMFNLGSYAPAHPRLVGLTWGAEDLSAAIGASENKEADGGWTYPYILAKSQCLFAAAAAEVAPIDTLFSDFRDLEGLAVSCQRSRRDGFTGRIAIHPAQVQTINECFSPSEDEITHAKKIIKAFEDNPGAGTIGIDGKMYDIPHLKAANRILARSKSTKK